MATLSTANLNYLADEWEKLYKSAVLSGIVGDLAHAKRGGYHISRQDQASNNYSVVRPDDKIGPSDRAAAIDMTMNTVDMIKCHTRLKTAWKNRSQDPRFKYINAWNGWDGQGDAGRYDVIAGTITFATSDHKWHIHLEIRRRYVNDRAAMDAILSLLKGETYTNAKDEDDMNQAEFTQFYLNAIRSEAVRMEERARPWQYVGGGVPANMSTLGVLAGTYAQISAITEALAAIGEKVDLDPAEIEALKNALDVPTAQENADATVEALGGLDPAELAQVLLGILGPEKTAALKEAL